jgi:hypothetical protein
MPKGARGSPDMPVLASPNISPLFYSAGLAFPAFV